MLQTRLLLLAVAGLSCHIFSRSWEEAQALARQYAAKMTLDEKAKVLQGQGMFTGPCVGTTTAVNGAVTIPEICMQDGPAGLRDVDELVTAFPAGVSVAATWNRALMRARGVAMGQEFRAKGVHVFLGPAIDVTRAQQGGRAWESFGADPYLTGEGAYETIMGVQSVGVQSCAKHLIGYHEEHFRFDMSTDIDERTLREAYFKPFQRAIDAEVTCVMCSYNKLNGSWACQDPALTGSKGLLRAEGGFQGYVVSDWGATHDGVLDSSKVHLTVDAGLDVEMPGGYIVSGGGVYRNLKKAVNNKSLSEDAVNTMVTRFLSGWFKVNQDSGYPQINFNVHDKSRDQRINVRSDEHVRLAREIAAASAVLLKNTDSILPLSAPKSLTIVGIDAGSVKEKNCDMNACTLKGTVPIGWGSGTNSLEHVIAPFDAIQDVLKSQASSTTLTSSLNQDLNAAKTAAAAADVAIVFVYAFSGEIGTGVTSVQGNFGDRQNLKLFEKGDELIKSVASVNSQTIVVVHSGGSVLMEEWADDPNVKAIIMAGYGGEQTGPAIADVLFGKVNPSGRLPYTIAKKEEDYGVNVLPYNPLKVGFTPKVVYSEGLLTDYKRFDSLGIEPRYPFGHGLSYTNFSYTDLQIGAGKGEEKFRISVAITNTGSHDGTEISQLYLGFPDGSGEPPKLLRGFEAVKVRPGARQVVTFGLKQADITIYDTTKKTWVQWPGTFQVFVGASSRDIRLKSNFNIS